MDLLLLEKFKKNMRKIDQLFAEYAEHHQNQTNKFIHWICVPLIFFTIVGFISLIPAPYSCASFLRTLFWLHQRCQYYFACFGKYFLLYSFMENFFNHAFNNAFNGTFCLCYQCTF